MTDRAWVATRKGLFELVANGTGWRLGRASFLGEPVSMVLPGAADRPMLAALNLGHFGVKCHASDDGGTSWREVATPAYPEQPRDVEGDVPWKLVQIWSLAGSGGTIWAGTLPGGLFRSTDGGASWQLVESLWRRPERREWFGGGYDVPGIHSICLDPRDADRMVIGVSCGGAWRTADGGATWELAAEGMLADYLPPEQASYQNTQDAHRIERCAGAPDVLWCQHHCGIWRSTDNGTLWHRIHAPLSSFGFAVAVHPQDPQTAWFAPAIADQCRVPVAAALAINRTHDGGQTFETLRAGLPQTDCYDLVYRHCLQVGGDGRTLLMGSTTGNLWASRDAGESWNCLSTTLPPILAIRFDGGT
ncbi:MAG: exo-alpha-sialidase [Sterolibacteriaceae bacterium]|nr:exo-alpha-sialidase [Candidatus Methylophosphatis haderslevensis]